MTSQLEFSDRLLGRRIRLLTLRGELDHTTMRRVATKLTTAYSRREPGVIIDITELTSLDASGVALLDDTAARLAGAGGWIGIVSDERGHPSLLADTRWNGAVNVFHSRAEAIDAVNHRTFLVRPAPVRSLLDIPRG